MSYETFSAKVKALIRKAGAGITADFLTDDNGRHIAKCSDGTTIVGHARSLTVTIKWGSGHVAMAAI